MDIKDSEGNIPNSTDKYMVARDAPSDAVPVLPFFRGTKSNLRFSLRRSHWRVNYVVGKKNRRKEIDPYPEYAESKQAQIFPTLAPTEYTDTHVAGSFESGLEKHFMLRVSTFAEALTLLRLSLRLLTESTTLRHTR